MTWHYEPWQRALEIVLMLVMSFGFGMIVVAVRGPRRVRMSIEQRKKLGVAGGLLFAVTIAAYMATEDARKPIGRRAGSTPALPPSESVARPAPGATSGP